LGQTPWVRQALAITCGWIGIDNHLAGLGNHFAGICSQHGVHRSKQKDIDDHTGLHTDEQEKTTSVISDSGTRRPGIKIFFSFLKSEVDIV
jgi:hypothetical protein